MRVVRRAKVFDKLIWDDTRDTPLSGILVFEAGIEQHSIGFHYTVKTV